MGDYSLDGNENLLLLLAKAESWHIFLH